MPVDPLGYTITIRNPYALAINWVMRGMSTYEIYSPRNPDGESHCQVAVSLLQTSMLSYLGGRRR